MINCLYIAPSSADVIPQSDGEISFVKHSVPSSAFRAQQLDLKLNSTGSDKKIHS